MVYENCFRHSRCGTLCDVFHQILTDCVVFNNCVGPAMLRIARSTVADPGFSFRVKCQVDAIQWGGGVVAHFSVVSKIHFSLMGPFYIF